MNNYYIIFDTEKAIYTHKKYRKRQFSIVGYILAFK